MCFYVVSVSRPNYETMQMGIYGIVPFFFFYSFDFGLFSCPNPQDYSVPLYKLVCGHGKMLAINWTPPAWSHLGSNAPCSFYYVMIEEQMKMGFTVVGG